MNPHLVAVGLTIAFASVGIAHILVSLMRDAHRVTWEHIIGATLGSAFIAVAAVVWCTHLLEGSPTSLMPDVSHFTMQARP